MQRVFQFRHIGINGGSGGDRTLMHEALVPKTSVSSKFHHTPIVAPREG